MNTVMSIEKYNKNDRSSQGILSFPQMISARNDWKVSVSLKATHEDLHYHKLAYLLLLHYCIHLHTQIKRALLKVVMRQGRGGNEKDKIS